MQIFLNFIIAILFGGVFWFIQDIGGMKSFYVSQHACCDRCAAILYDQALPILVVSAGLSFFCQSFFRGDLFSIKRTLKMFLAMWLSFQVYPIWFSNHLLHRTECTALYSPGNVGSIGIVVVIVGLLMETFAWAVFCFLPVLLINIIKSILEEIFNKEVN
jgi:hypothetical protein